MAKSRALRAETMRDLAERAVEVGRAAAPTGSITPRIPVLADVDPAMFGFAVTTVEGDEHVIGDGDVPFSLQSLTKLFALASLLRVEPTAWEQVGWVPTELGYNSISELEHSAGRPRNPFVNAGALIVTDRLLLHTGSAAGTVTELIRYLSEDDTVGSDASVASSEAGVDHRNRALAHLLAEHGRLTHSVDDVLAEYHAMCAIATSVASVARAGRFLADRHGRILDSADIRRLNAVLLTSGMYNAAGDIAYRVGLPAKSGVGGGVLAILPGVGTVCAWSPPLDAQGNSVGAVSAIEEFAKTSGWSVF